MRRADQGPIIRIIAQNVVPSRKMTARILRLGTPIARLA